MAELLAGVTGGGFVVVNAVEYADLDVVVLGLLEAAAAGRSFLYRSGPSFVQSLAGLDPRDPLQASDIWPAGHPGGHGLVVVGSHVGLTSRQVAVARDRGGLAEAERAVATVADPARRDGHVAEGGITSHDVAVRSLGIRRATVLGQLFPAWCRSSAHLMPPPGRSASPMSCSPATSATRQPRRRSSAGSAR